MEVLNKEELYNIAILGKLEIKEQEVDEIIKEMDNIISFAQKINDAKVLDETVEGLNDLENVLREDEVLPSYPQEEILKNAKTQEDGFFYLRNTEK